MPIQAVVQEENESVVYLPGPQEPIRRPVKVGLDNNVHVIIEEGLAQGEQVLIAPTLSNSYAPRQQAPPSMDEDLANRRSYSDDEASEDGQPADETDRRTQRREKRSGEGRKKVLKSRGDS